MNENDGTPQEQKPQVKTQRGEALKQWWANPINREKLTRQRNGQYEAIVEAGIRECIRCHVPKSLDDFPAGRQRRDGRARYAYCKMCHKDYQYELKLIRFFRLTPEQYQKIDKHQNTKCAICGLSPLKGRRLSLDHRHSDGLIRGILCNMCNRALARWRENVELMRKAIIYLEHPPAIEALGESVYGLPGRVGTKKQRKLAKKIAKQQQKRLTKQ